MSKIGELIEGAEFGATQLSGAAKLLEETGRKLAADTFVAKFAAEEAPAVQFASSPVANLFLKNADIVLPDGDRLLSQPLARTDSVADLLHLKSDIVLPGAEGVLGQPLARSESLADLLHPKSDIVLPGASQDDTVLEAGKDRWRMPPGGDSPYGPDPHGPNPRGQSPHDEVHDTSLPANRGTRHDPNAPFLPHERPVTPGSVWRTPGNGPPQGTPFDAWKRQRGGIGRSKW